mmetsp:Transcript_96898/g.217133  ORF Transcript_96898/g.217133 Transcript_96898/m.217133 type:complete len:320 (-) Transcript_96898:461-1420(-)
MQLAVDQEALPIVVLAIVLQNLLVEILVEDGAIQGLDGSHSVFEECPDDLRLGVVLGEGVEGPLHLVDLGVHGQEPRERVVGQRGVRQIGDEEALRVPASGLLGGREDGEVASAPVRQNRPLLVVGENASVGVEHNPGVLVGEAVEEGVGPDLRADRSSRAPLKGKVLQFRVLAEAGVTLQPIHGSQHVAVAFLDSHWRGFVLQLHGVLLHGVATEPVSAAVRDVEDAVVPERVAAVGHVQRTCLEAQLALDGSRAQRPRADVGERNAQALRAPLVPASSAPLQVDQELNAGAAPELELKGGAVDALHVHSDAVGRSVL